MSVGWAVSLDPGLAAVLPFCDTLLWLTDAGLLVVGCWGISEHCCTGVLSNDSVGHLLHLFPALVGNYFFDRWHLYCWTRFFGWLNYNTGSQVYEWWFIHADGLISTEWFLVWCRFLVIKMSLFAVLDFHGLMVLLTFPVCPFNVNVMSCGLNVAASGFSGCFSNLLTYTF